MEPKCKRKSSSRAWTSSDVRELKSLAKKKNGCRENIESVEANDWCDGCKGTPTWGFAGYSGLVRSCTHMRRLPSFHAKPES
jgi:hypothetical protein